MELAELLAAIPPEAAERLKTGASKPPSSEQYLEMRRGWENSTPGHLTGVDCPECKNRGTITEIRDGKYLVSVECRCMAKRRSLRRIRRSGLGDLLDCCTLENFKTVKPWQAEMKRMASDYIRHADGRWFAALGSVGGGKTHLCTAICGELLNAGKEVRYMLWRDESAKIKPTLTDSDKYQRMVEPLKNVEVLYIDDLFKTKDGAEITTGDVNLAFEIINARYIDRRLMTIISSQKTMNEIMGIDSAIGSRIFQRCKNHCVELIGDKNWRLMGP